MQDEFLSTALLPAMLGLVMLGLGCQLVPDDFKRVFKYPRAMITALYGQLLLVPLAAICVAFYFAESPAIAVGFVLLGACPGGVTSNMCVYLAKGDTALSISLTAITSILAIGTLPFWLNLGAQLFDPSLEAAQLPLVQTAAQVFLITALPIGLGMLLRKAFPEVIAATRGMLEILLTNVLILMVILIVIVEWEILSTLALELVLATLTLIFWNLSVGFGLGSLLRLKREQTITLAIEMGIQNGTLGIVVAAALLGNIGMALPSAAYALLMLLVTALCIGLTNRATVSH